MENHFLDIEKHLKKFKNKKITVKEIGKNDKGDITINGKPLLRFRLIDDEDESSEDK